MSEQSNPDHREIVLEAMANLAVPVRMKEVAASIRKTDTYVRRAVNDLVKQGIVVKTGENRTARYSIHEHITHGIVELSTTLPSPIYSEGSH